MFPLQERQSHPFLSIFHRKYVEQSILTFLKNLKEMIGRTRRQPLISIFYNGFAQASQKEDEIYRDFQKNGWEVFKDCSR